MKLFRFLKKINKFSAKAKIIGGVLSVATIGIVTTSTVLVINNYQKEHKEENCMVLFETSGGTSVFSREVKCGNKIEVSDAPTKTGFDFKHWSYEGQQINWDNFIIEKSITVYAEWEKQEDTEVVYIEFDSNGGTKIETIAAAKGTSIAPPLTPAKEGYEFIEWRYNGKLFDFGTKINESIKLTAEWKKVVKPNNNGNSNSNNNNASNNSSKKYKCIATISNNVPEKTVYVGHSEHFNWTFSADIAYSLEDCSISFKSSNSSVASVSEDGKIKALSQGTAYLYQCINDKDTKEEIGCFKANLIVNKTDDMIKQEKAIAFANSVNGYYWYLDGYEYAYIYAEIVEENGNKILKWTPKNLTISNNKFITSEEQNKEVYYTSEISNNFLMNPIEYSYEVISKYKMNISNSKLYITLGGKEYSFSKRTSEKKEGTITFSTSHQSVTINEHESVEILLNINNSFFNHEFEFISTNDDIAWCLFNIHCSGSQCKFVCAGGLPGNTTVTLRDKIGGFSKTIDIKVNDVYYPVTSVTLNATNIQMYKGDTKWLDATVQPYTADNKNLTWSSSDPSVVSVDAKGKLTANKIGEAIITVKTTDGGYTATCSVVVDYEPLTAEAVVKTEQACVNNECGTYNKVEIKAKGGNEQYLYSYKVYLDDQYIETYTSSITYLPALFGTYRVEFVVKDTKQNEYTGVSTVVINQ